MPKSRICRHICHWLHRTSYRIDGLKEHDKSTGHKDHVAAAQLKKTGIGPMDLGVLKLNQKAEKHLQILFHNAHGLAKKGRPFADFEMIADLDEAKGLPIQQLYRNDKRCQEFVEAIADVERQRIGKKIEEAKFIPIMSDGATDSSHVEAEIRTVCEILLQR